MVKLNREKLLEKYSIGAVYISPAAIEYSTSKIQTRYWCEANKEELLADYFFHMQCPPSDQCYTNRFDDFGVRPNCELTNEEIEWVELEYKLRLAISCDKDQIKFVI